jgi:toxin ParE1/3/4
LKYRSAKINVLPVIRTDRADEDLIDIWTYFAADNLDAADRVLDAIEARWWQVAQHPYSGLRRDDIGPGIRCLVAGQYLILYRIADDGIEIIRVLHGRRKIGPHTVE